MNKQNELYNDIDKPMDGQKEHQNNGPNSLGLAMEGGKGINLAIVKGKIENESDPLDENYQNQNTNNENQVLLKTNYHDLENFINTLTVDNSDENYLKIAKLNRLKVLMELSMKMVGRKYKEISDEERNILETEANRFHVILNKFDFNDSIILIEISKIIIFRKAIHCLVRKFHSKKLIKMEIDKFVYH